MAETLAERVRAFIRTHQLMSAGDRIAVAVSGGADSVALLRLLLELRSELGLVLAVAHFNHKIRGADADADEEFVRLLAARFQLPFHPGSGDARAYAHLTHAGLETAGRELRYTYFHSLCASGTVVRVATAHTLDDQAETVLLRLVRGAWTRGLSGIHPAALLHAPAARTLTSANTASVAVEGVQPPPAGAVVRPLLKVQRSELKEYLRSLGQDWREDASNRDLTHVRNRVRHTLLPLLEREFNPAIQQVLADVAEIARAEEEYWRDETRRAAAAVMHRCTPANPRTEPSLPLDEARPRTRSGIVEQHIAVEPLRALPVALQRRLVRELLRPVGPQFGSVHIQQILRLMDAPSGTELQLPCRLKILRAASCPRTGGWVNSTVEQAEGMTGARIAGPELVLQCESLIVPETYEYCLPLPGEVRVLEAGIAIQARILLPAEVENAGYNRYDLLSASSLRHGADIGPAPQLQVRNWRPGDRFWPAHAKSSKKVKELLQARRVSGRERKLWPVAIEPGGKLVWMLGFGVGEPFRARSDAGSVFQILENRQDRDAIVRQTPLDGVYNR